MAEPVIDLKTFDEIRELHPRLEPVFARLMKRLLNSHLIGSTLVEGSTLTELEARRVLEGASIAGHVLDEHRELSNGRDTASYLHRLFFQQEQFTTHHIDRAHQLLLAGIGDPKEKLPGKNRGVSKQNALTHRLVGKQLLKFEYENPIEVAKTYQAFLDFRVNQLLSGNRDEMLKQLSQLYFQFQMLHPYSDGNGRLGRFLVSGKVASEQGLFFRFETKDGPEHLAIMMELSGAYQNDKHDVDLRLLQDFLKDHLEEV